MAQIMNTSKRKHSLHVDMTPMVDLGFLLISFFVLTTSMQSQKGLNVFLPAPALDTVQYSKAESNQLHILLRDSNEVYVYNGNNETNGKLEKINNNLCNIIVQHENNVNAILAAQNLDSAVVFVEPSNQSTVQQLAAVIDEVHLAGCRRYVLK